jgi:hypothetical protein
MKSRLIIWLIAAAVILAGCAPAREETKIYKFVDAVKQADFDYRLIKNIDKIPTPYPPGGVFPIGEIPITQGDHTLYKFQAAYKGRSAEIGRQLFHDIIVVKVDARGNIIDAFHYTLEWADSPSLDLFRAARTGFPLENGMSIERFGFANPRRAFAERGTLKLYDENEATVFLSRLQELVRNDDKKALARLVRYPLYFNRGRQKEKIAGEAVFLGRYAEIFTPRVKQAVLEQRPQEINSDHNGYMIGNGEVWFDDWGQGLRIITINQ